jgi:Domain of unknown function (DUF1707)/Cell wall-active antibiotics response 4TMS YvqF
MNDDASLRASDADREQAVTELREHLLAGRLTLEEFSERVGAALQARSAGDLAHAQEDLPQRLAQAAAPRSRQLRVAAALLGHVVQRGRRRLRRGAVAVSVLGDLDLDLRQATIERRRTAVTVLALLGNVDVYVPEGVNVDVSGGTIGGHRRDWGRDDEHPGAPAITVRVVGLGATVDVWRVPRGMAGSYSEIFRQIKDVQRQLPGGRPAA